MQGVWSSPDGTRRGIVLVNFEPSALEARLTLNGDHRHLELDPSTTDEVAARDENGAPTADPPLTRTGAGTLVFDVQLPGESIRLVELTPSGG